MAKHLVTKQRSAIKLFSVLAKLWKYLHMCLKWTCWTKLYCGYSKHYTYTGYRRLGVRGHVKQTQRVELNWIKLNGRAGPVSPSKTITRIHKKADTHTQHSEKEPKLVIWYARTHSDWVSPHTFLLCNLKVENKTSRINCRAMRHFQLIILLW